MWSHRCRAIRVGRFPTPDAPITALEVLAQPHKFVGGRPPRALPGLAYRTQFAAGGARLLDNLRAHWKFPDALGGSQDDANPDQVVDHGRWSGAVRTARLYMPNKVGGREGERIGFAERMPLQEFQMSLFASLPARDRLERVDVPADQFCERRCAEPLASQLRWIFERDFAVLCPAQRRGAMREGSTLLMQHRRAAADANNRRVARRTVRLFAYFDRRHDDF